MTRRLIVLVVAGCLAVPMLAVSGQPLRKKVLLIGLDGVRVDVLREASTPNIDALIAAGVYSDTARTRPNTVSGPGWSSMLIGVWMNKHGVLDNDFTTNDYASYPDFLTRIESLRPELETFAALDWPPLGTTADGGPLVSDAIDVKANVNGDSLGYTRGDALATSITARHLRYGNPDAAFVYLGDIDEHGHEYGSLAPEYKAAIETADRQVGELMDAVRSRPTYDAEDWLILMSTDHGRKDDGGHGGTSELELTIFYLASGPSVDPSSLQEPAHIVDVAATAMAHLGLEIPEEWNLDGRPNGLRTGSR